MFALLQKFRWLMLFLLSWTAALYWWHDCSFSIAYQHFSGHALILDETIEDDFSEPDDDGIIGFKFRLFNPAFSTVRLIGAEIP